MKKIFSLFAAVLMAVGVWGDDTTHKMDSYSSMVITDDQEVKWDISASGDNLAVGSSNALPSDLIEGSSSKRGVSINKAASAIKITSKTSFSNVSRIVVYASANGSTTGGVSVKVGSTAMTAPSDVAIASGDKNKSFEFTSSTQLTGAIEITLPYTSTKTVWFGGLVVTTGESKTSTTLSFGSTKSFTIYLGDSFEEPELTATPTTILSSVTYESSNTDVATVNATTGKVIIKAAGSTDITATFAGNETYRSSSDKYTIDVKTPANWYVPFTILPKESGTSSDGGGLNSTDITKIFNASIIEYIASASANSKVYPAKTGFGWKFGDSSNKGELTFTFNKTMSYSKIVFSATLFSGTDATDGFTITINNNDETAETFNFEGKTAGTFDDFEYIPTEAVTSIKIAQVNATKARFYMKEIKFTPAAPVSISAAGYATYFNADHAVELPTGVTGYVWAYDALQEVYGETYNVIPAGEPVVLKAAAGNYTLNFTTTSEESWKSVSANDLQGAATAMTAADMVAANPGMGKFYALSLNADGEASSVGFYWVAEGGAAFDITAGGKAYLALPSSAAPARFLFNETTALENKALNVEVKKVVVNGQMMILRGGNMFDLNGRIVK